MNRAAEIFAEAIELTVAERSAWLDHACAGDQALRVRVEELLASHEDAGQFLEAPLTVRPAPDPEERPGDEFGSFTLIRKIGEGGCGVVWLADQHAPVRRQVALKIIKLGMDTAQVIARFEAERQALAIMDHPDIARVFDAGATATGRPFFVMEFVDGLPITKFCDQHSLPMAARLELFGRVCVALQHAHQKGIIHRDIKPSNVLVALRDGKPEPKIIDFGIAKATQGRLTDQTLVTGLDQFIGTPAYMSPEQIDQRDLDTRSDIYALGVLLYELLTGRPPYDPQSLIKAGIEEIRRIIREVEPPRPSTRVSTLTAADRDTIARSRRSAPAQLSSALRGDLDWIVMRCLEKDRDRRYATANGLALDVRRYLADEPVEARPASAGYRLHKLVRRHRLVFAAAAVAVAALIGGAGLATWQAVRASRAERVALEEAANAKTVSDFLTDDLLAQADTVNQTTGRQPAKSDLQVREALDRAAAHVGTRFASQPIAEATIRLAIGQAYIGISLPQPAVEQLERAVALRAKTLGPDHLDTLFAQYELAEALHAAGRSQESIDLFQKTLKLDEARPVQDPRRLLEARHNLGTTLSDAGRHEDAKALQIADVIESRQRYGPDHHKTLLAANNLTMTLDQMGKHAAAEPLIRDTVLRFEKTLGPDHPRTVLALNNQALILLHLGRPAEAAPVLERIVPLLKKIRGPEHLATSAAINNLALAYRDLGNAAGFAANAEQALTLFAKSLGPDHQNTLIGMMNLGLAFDMVGRSDEAERVTQDAIVRLKRTVGAEHFLTLIAIGSLGTFCSKLERWEEAITFTRESLEAERRVLGAEHPYTAAAIGNLAQRYTEASRHAEALPLHRQAVELHARIYGTDRLPTLGRQAAYAIGLAAADQTAEALSLFATTLATLQAKVGAEHPVTAKIQAEYAATLAQVGRNSDAAPLAAQAIASFRQSLGPDHPSTLRARQIHAEAMTATGHAAEAELLLRAVLAQREKSAPDHWATFDVRSAIGAALLALGRDTEAEPLLIAGAQGLLDREGKIPPSNRPRIAVALERVIRLYQTTHRPAEAASWQGKLRGRPSPTQPAISPKE